MTRRINSRNRVSKQHGQNVWGVSLAGKRSKIGVSRQKSSLYGQLLQAKQLIKRFYGEISESQFRSLCLAGARHMQQTGDLDNGLRHVACLLECRLDMSLFRSNLVPSIFLARQMVNHGHTLVNGVCVRQPGLLLKGGDVVEIAFNKKLWARENLLRFISTGRVVFDLPTYMQVDYDRMASVMLRKPFSDEIKYPLKVSFKNLLSWYA
uniref:RNA polymerase subunit alpha n=1 Tax=Ophirina amphinema TaxID=2108040 RepID=A0A348AYS2_9EUKA|nr:RNA polymerase subunit alpha [Ophirina amphinema]